MRLNKEVGNNLKRDSTTNLMIMEELLNFIELNKLG